MIDIIINLHKCDTWEIQLTIAIKFISSKDVDEEYVMHSRTNIEFVSYDIELLELLLSGYHIGLET